MARLIVLSAFIVIAQVQLVSAAIVTSFVSKEGNVVVSLSGEIAAGDADQLTAIIRSANAATKFVSGSG